MHGQQNIKSSVMFAVYFLFPLLISKHKTMDKSLKLMILNQS